MMRGSGVEAALGRALVAAAARAGTVIEIARSYSTDWHSATFSGTRHALDIATTADEAAGAWLATLGDLDVPLPGHLLADLSVTQSSAQNGRCRARIEALTVASA